LSEFDLEALLAPVSEDFPCGENLEYDPAFVRLEELAMGTPERQIGDLIEPAEPPNWRDVKREALAVAERTRDLRVLMLLVQAALNLAGMSGFRDGLRLVSESVSRYWDTIFPELDLDDGNDPSQRLNILSGLCDYDAFLKVLATSPLVQSRSLGMVCLRDFQNAARKPGDGDEDAAAQDGARIQAVVEDIGQPALKDAVALVSDCLEAVVGLEESVTGIVGVGNAITLGPLREHLQEMKRSLAKFVVDDTAVDGQSDEAVDVASGMSTDLGGKGLGAIKGTQDVVRALDLICQYYERHEPSSPIPLLLRRAKRLVSKSFMEVLRDLAPDGVSQVEVIRGPVDEE
jgi:type VI secretion system protein ImpA